MVQGLDKLRRKLTKSIPEHVRKATADKLEERARAIVIQMQRRAPKDELDLVNSIGWTWGDAPKGTMTVGKVGGKEFGSMVITIYAGGNDAFYARFQEFGTVNMPPTPFFYPTWREKRRGSKSAITRAVKKAVKDGSR